MNRLAALITPLAILLPLITAHAAPPPTAADLMSQLPPAEQHIFAPADKAWIKVTSYLQPINNGYITIDEAKRDPAFKTYHREEDFYENQADIAKHKARKILNYDTEGRLTVERDDSNGKVWTQSFDDAGEVIEYRYNSGPLSCQAGFAIRPDKKDSSSFSGGQGEFTTWSNHGYSCEQLWIHAGQAYAAKIFLCGQCIQVQLQTPDINLRFEPNEESLSLSDRAESWTKTANNIEAQAIGSYIDETGIHKNLPKTPPDIIHNRLSTGAAFQSLSNTAEEPAAQQKQLALDYAARREEAFTHFNDQLKSAGKTWQDLNLANLQPAKAPLLPNNPDLIAWLNPAPLLPGETPEQQSARLLASHVAQLSLHEMKLETFLAAFPRWLHVPCCAQWLDLESINLPHNAPLNLEIKNVSLKDLLDNLTAQLNPPQGHATWSIINGVVVISAEKKPLH